MLKIGTPFTYLYLKRYPLSHTSSLKKEPLSHTSALKRYPFWVEHPRIVHYREYPPPQVYTIVISHRQSHDHYCISITYFTSFLGTYNALLKLCVLVPDGSDKALEVFRDMNDKGIGMLTEYILIHVRMVISNNFIIAKRWYVIQRPLGTMGRSLVYLNFTLNPQG